MTLEWQYKDLDFQGGTSSRADEFLVDEPFIKSAVNCSYVKDGALRKRKKMDTLGAIASKDNDGLVFTHRNNLYGVSSDGTYAYNEDTSSFVQSDTFPVRPVAMETINVNKAAVGAEWVDVAEIGGVYCHVWCETDQLADWTVWYSIKAEDGTVLKGPTQTSNNLTQIQVVGTTANWVVVGIDTTTAELDYFRISTSSYAATSGIGPIAGGRATQTFDVDTDGLTQVFIVSQEQQSFGTLSYGDTYGTQLTWGGATFTENDVAIGTIASSPNRVGDSGVCCYWNAPLNEVWIAVTSHRHHSIYCYNTTPAFGGITTEQIVYTPSGDDYYPNQGIIEANPLSGGGTPRNNTTWQQWFGCFVPSDDSGGLTLFWQSLWCPSGDVGFTPAGIRYSHIGVLWRDLAANGAGSGSTGKAGHCALYCGGWRYAGEQYIPIVTNFKTWTVGSGQGSGVNPVSTMPQNWSGFSATLCVRASTRIIPVSNYGIDTAVPSLRYDYDAGELLKDITDNVNSTSVRTYARRKPAINGALHTVAYEAFIQDSEFRVIDEPGGPAVRNVRGWHMAEKNVAKLARFDYNKHVSLAAAEMNGVTALAAGQLLVFDGQRVLPASWPTIPPPPSLEMTAADNGSGDFAKYKIAWVFEDALGRVYRSALSEEFRVDTTLTAQEMWLPLPPPCIPLWSAGMKIEVYASRNDGSATIDEDDIVMMDVVEVRETDIGNPVIMTTGSRPQERTPLLPYTDGGVLAHEPTGSPTFVASFDGRIWYTDADFPSRAYYSKTFSTLNSVGFNRNLYIEIPDGEPCVGIADLNNHIILFSEENVYVGYGRLANDAGTGSNFRVQRLPFDGGCANAASIIRIPSGVMFSSRKGFHLVAPDLQVKFVGGGVEDDVTVSDIKSCCTNEEDQQVLFFAGTNIFVYHYLTGAWTSWSGADITDAQSSTRWRGSYAFVGGPSAQVRTPGITNEGVAMSFSTGWVKLNRGLQNFKRLREILWLGRYTDSGDPGTTWTISYYYDYSDSTAEAHTIDASDIVGDPAFIRSRPARQKCQAIRFGFFETGPGGQSVFDTDLSIVGISLEWGAKMLGDKRPRTPNV